MSKNTPWTAEQNDLVVFAYFELFDRTNSGEHISKTDYYRQVSDLMDGARTPGAVMVKFQNISYVLETMDHPIIRGLKPRGGPVCEDNAQGMLHRRVNMKVKQRREVSLGMHLRLVA